MNRPRCSLRRPVGMRSFTCCRREPSASAAHSCTNAMLRHQLLKDGQFVTARFEISRGWARWTARAYRIRYPQQETRLYEHAGGSPRAGPANDLSVWAGQSCPRRRGSARRYSPMRRSCGPTMPHLSFPNLNLGCCRFQKHLVKVEDETGGGSWEREGNSVESSSLRQSSW
jgi:hypothetical protein